MHQPSIMAVTDAIPTHPASVLVLVDALSKGLPGPMRRILGHIEKEWLSLAAVSHPPSSGPPPP